MRTLALTLCGLALAAASCNALSTPTPVPGLVSTIVVQTAQAALIATAAAIPLPTVSPTPVAMCKDAAALIQDGSAEDSMSVPNGSKFTKAWQLSNTGECDWHGYSLAFVSGERMGAPDAIPVQDTPSKSTVIVSLDLVAPANAGSFTGLFELRDPTGKPVWIDNGQAFSVAVAVADLTPPAAPDASTVIPASSSTTILPLPSPDCKYVKSAAYPGEIVDLINAERARVKLPPLTMNAQLAKSAQAHSADMACNSYFEHAGLNKSTIHDRVVAAGYTPRISEEMIFCSGYPKDAFTWWMGDPPHYDVIVDKRVTEVGVGYAYLPHSPCGSYFTVDLGSQ